MVTTTNRELIDERALPAGQRRAPAASTTTGGSGSDASLTGYWAGSTRRGSAEAIDAPAGEQRPQLPAARRRLTRARSDADVAQRSRRRRRSARSPASARGSTSTSATSRRASTCNDLGFQRRADDDHAEQLVPVPQRRRRQVRPQHVPQLQPVGAAGTSAATGSTRAATSTRTGRSRTTGAPAAASTSTRGASTIG